MKLFLSIMLISIMSATVFSYGTIIVTSNIDGASVYLDNEYQGETPLTLLDFPSKNYIVRVECNGYSQYNRQFDLLQNATVKLHAQLKKMKPLHVKNDVYFKISSQPSGAKVYINGEYKGRTPLYINEHKVAGKEVYIAADGYQGYYHTFTTTTSSCNVTLVPQTTTHTVSSTTYTHHPTTHYHEKKYQNNTQEPSGKSRKNIRNILIGAEILNEIITPRSKHKKQNRGAILGGIFLNEILNNK